MRSGESDVPVPIDFRKGYPIRHGGARRTAPPGQAKNRIEKSAENREGGTKRVWAGFVQWRALENETKETG